LVLRKLLFLCIFAVFSDDVGFSMI